MRRVTVLGATGSLGRAVVRRLTGQGESLPGTDLSVFGAIAFMQHAIQSRREGS